MKNNMLKVIALTLSFSLLGQNIALAQTSETQRPTLAQVQAQAKQDQQTLADKSNDTLVAALIGYSVISTFIAIKLAVTKTTKKLLNREAERDLAKQLAQAAARNKALLENELTLHDMLRYKDNKIKGLTKSREIHLSAEQAAKKQLIELEEMYSLRLKTMQDALSDAYSFVNFSTYVGAATEASLEKYASLFDKELTHAQRAVLRGELTEEAWFKAFSKEEQKDFLKIIDEMILHTEGNLSRSGALVVLSDRIRAFFAKHSRSSSHYMLGLGRKVLTKSTLLSIGILAALITVPSITASAQPKTNPAMAQRINNKLSLFLDASENELNEMQQYEDVYEACVQGAAVLHILTLLDKAETEEVQNLLQPTRTPARPLRTAGAY